MKIELSEYDPNWSAIFLKEKKMLESVLPDNSRVEHIGSTSVNDLCAKPVIDMLCGVEKFPVTNELIDKIADLNYEYVEEYNSIIPERRYFRKMREYKFHLHLVQSEGQFWKRHILFRDFLRKSDSAKNEYASLKRQLAQKDWTDGNQYASAKGEFITAIEKLALQDNPELPDN